MRRVLPLSVLPLCGEFSTGSAVTDHEAGAPPKRVRGQIAVLALTLLIGVAACGNGDTAVFFPADAASLIGDWVNVDSETDGIIRVTIREEAGSFLVHVWSGCDPQDCDWGEASATPAASDSGAAMYVVFEDEFAEVSQTLALDIDGHLELISENHWTDDSGRSDYITVDILSKQ